MLTNANLLTNSPARTLTASEDVANTLDAADSTARLALTYGTGEGEVQVGDLVRQTDTGVVYMLVGSTPSNAAHWEQVAPRPALRATSAGITASTTQTQGNGALTVPTGAVELIAQVATVANANDTITLPAAVANLIILVINDGANTLQIFPASGDNLGAGANTATTLAAGATATFVAYDSTNWKALV